MGEIYCNITMRVLENTRRFFMKSSDGQSFVLQLDKNYNFNNILWDGGKMVVGFNTIMRVGGKYFYVSRNANYPLNSKLLDAIFITMSHMVNREITELSFSV